MWIRCVWERNWGHGWCEIDKGIGVGTLYGKSIVWKLIDGYPIMKLCLSCYDKHNEQDNCLTCYDLIKMFIN